MKVSGSKLAQSAQGLILSGLALKEFANPLRNLNTLIFRA